MNANAVALRACDFKGSSRREERRGRERGKIEAKRRRKRETPRETRTWNISRATIKRNGRIAGIESHCKRQVLRGHVFRALLSRTSGRTTKVLRRLSLSADYRDRSSPSDISHIEIFLVEPPRNTDTMSPMSRRKSTSSISIELQGVSG